MFKAFFLSKDYRLIAWSGVFIIFMILICEVKINIMLNDWYKDFYDILQKGPKANIDDFKAGLHRLIKFLIFIVLINSFFAYFTRIYTLIWREATTFAYMDKWRQVKNDIEGSSQRIQEDIYKFSKIVENLGVNFASGFFNLIMFLPILYHLSKNIQTPVFNTSFGLIIWAIILSFGAFLVSWFVGIKLPGLEYNNQKAEAAFRKELVYAENDKINYASQNTILELFTGVKLNYKRLFLHYGYFDIWRYSYSGILMLVPMLLIAPNIFTGIITYGGFIQIKNAFDKVTSGLSILTDNWTVITELRSIFKRLKEFEKNIDF